MHSSEFFQFETGQATDVGCVRSINEDSLMSRPDFGLWAVSDGMGGHAAGDYASQTIVEHLNSVGVPASADDLRARVMSRLTSANEIILDHAAQLDRGTIGATLVSLLVHQDDYACLWSGDSRAYLLRAGQFVQQSRDHTEVRALLDASTITPEEAANWPRRNVITKAIGVSELPDVELVTGRLAVGDVFVLCSDGLTEHLSDDDIMNIVREFPPQAACDALVRETLARGARDNVTVVILRCHPPLPVQIEDTEFGDTSALTAESAP
ncbi:MAG: serine/threonine-protein phosphatase [Loktanella sp.]|nr:serine/threonine-protein phosphatase [Loktanella sp.]